VRRLPTPESCCHLARKVVQVNFGLRQELDPAPFLEENWKLDGHR